MEESEFLRMKIEYFPQDVIDHYNLKDKVDEKGNLYVRVEKGMHGLPQAVKIANKLLKKRLKKFGYTPINQYAGVLETRLEAHQLHPSS